MVNTVPSVDVAPLGINILFCRMGDSCERKLDNVVIIRCWSSGGIVVYYVALLYL